MHIVLLSGTHSSSEGPHERGSNAHSLVNSQANAFPQYQLNVRRVGQNHTHFQDGIDTIVTSGYLV